MIRRLPSTKILETTDSRLIGVGRSLGAAALPAADTEDAAAFRDGYSEGFEAGEQDGLRLAQERMREVEAIAVDEHDKALSELVAERERLSNIIHGVEQAVSTHYRAMEELAFEVALTSLSRALGALQQDRQLLLRLCTQVIQENRAKALRLSVSSEDRALLPEHIDGLTITDDAALAHGQCRIETAHGHVVSSLSMRFAAIYDAMLEVVGAIPP